MFCYKDMTFCQYYETCKSGVHCSRALTPEVKDGADEYDLGISQFAEVPDCFSQLPLIE